MADGNAGGGGGGGDGATVFVSADDGTWASGTPEERAALARYRQQFELDQYYDWIKPYTFATAFVAIDLDDAKAWREWNRGPPHSDAMSAADKARFAAMQQRLQTAIDSFLVPAGGAAADPARRVFVRLSTRSPKDAVDKLDRQKVLVPVLRKHLATAVAAVPAADLNGADAKAAELHRHNAHMLALRQTFFDVLAVRDAPTVLDLMSYSSRVVSDISRAITAATTFGAPAAAAGGALVAPADVKVEVKADAKAADAKAADAKASAAAAVTPDGPVVSAAAAAPPGGLVPDLKATESELGAGLAWNLKFIVREFSPIPLAGELRGFVSKGVLTALSQYYCDVYFPELTRAKADAIGARVVAFFNETIKALVPIESYIIDFSVTDAAVRIVELNPFTAQTGGCLFDWVKDKDVIENGPFTVRVIDAPNKHVGVALMPWRPLLDAALGPDPPAAAAEAGAAAPAAGAAAGGAASSGCCVVA